MDATISSACAARRYPLRAIGVAVCCIFLSSGLPPPVVADEQDLCNSDSRINCSQNKSESNHGVAILHKFMDDLQSLASLSTDEVADTLLGRIKADGDKDKDWSSATASSSSGDEPPFLGFARRSAEYLRDDLGLDLMGVENLFRHDTTALGGDDSNSLLSSDFITGTVYEAAHTMIEKWKDKCTPPEYTPSKDKLHEKMKVTGPVLTLTLDPIKCIVDNVNSVTCYPAALVMTTEPGSVEFPGKKSDLYWKDRDCPKDIKLTKMHKHVVIEAPTVHKFHQLHRDDDKEYTIKDVDDDKKHIGHHLH